MAEKMMEVVLITLQDGRIVVYSGAPQMKEGDRVVSVSAYVKPLPAGVPLNLFQPRDMHPPVLRSPRGVC